MLPPLVQQPKDLVTSHRAVREGFLEQALVKTRKAVPYIADARRLWKVLQNAPDVYSLIDLPDIQNDLIAASGFSQKAQVRLSDEEIKSSLKNILDKIVAGKNKAAWREEILYRYLLTKGDSLGGSMRNITGALAGSQFSEAILAVLKEKSIIPNVAHPATNQEKIQSIQWHQRLLFLDKTPKFIGKNIDVILLDTTTPRVPADKHLHYPEDYIALGELKGGIDPAGADEHWKTANSALERIRQSFPNNRPHLFFVGAAIENSMAEEIFKQLQDGRLAYAANLTMHKQVADLVAWLVRL